MSAVRLLSLYSRTIACMPKSFSHASLSTPPLRAENRIRGWFSIPVPPFTLSVWWLVCVCLVCVSLWWLVCVSCACLCVLARMCVSCVCFCMVARVCVSCVCLVCVSVSCGCSYVCVLCVSLCRCSYFPFVWALAVYTIFCCSLTPLLFSYAFAFLLCLSFIVLRRLSCKLVCVREWARYTLLCRVPWLYHIHGTKGMTFDFWETLR